MVAQYIKVLGGGWISSDAFTSGTQNVIDTISYYNCTSQFIPSPYAADGSLNTDYTYVFEGYNNALTDFNGLSNTTRQVSLASSFKAASACSSYSTLGISAGNWYFAAVGEFAYVLPRFNVIKGALSACGGVLLNTSDGYYWASTQKNDTDSYIVSISSGRIIDNGITQIRLVRPFCQLS